MLLESNAIEGVYNLLDRYDDSDRRDRTFYSLALQDALKAWYTAFEILPTLTSVKQIAPFVSTMHLLLMRGLDPEIAGQYRHNQAVYIGNRTCPPLTADRHAELVCEALAPLYYAATDKKYGAHKWTDVKKEKHTREVHLAYEHVHPFVDGNGRTGRILYNLHRVVLGLGLDIIHEGDEQYEYYKWFRKTK